MAGNFGLNVTKNDLYAQAYLNNYSSTSSSSTSTNTDSSMSFLKDYTSLKDGSYKKLISAYYKKVNDGTITSSTATSSTDSTQKTIKINADALKKSANTLTANTSTSPFKRQEVTTIDPTTGKKTITKDYNKDSIADAVTTFANNYNKLIDTVDDSDNTSILKDAVRMTRITKANKNLLSEVGISVASNNKLVVDSEKLKNADISTLKTLFSGSYSYADKVAQKAYQISAESNLSFTKSQNLYQQDGTYVSMGAGDLLSSFI